MLHGVGGHFEDQQSTRRLFRGGGEIQWDVQVDLFSDL
jgi:hypothetical protein